MVQYCLSIIYLDTDSTIHNYYYSYMYMCMHENCCCLSLVKSLSILNITNNDRGKHIIDNIYIILVSWSVPSLVRKGLIDLLRGIYYYSGLSINGHS